MPRIRVDPERVATLFNSLTVASDMIRTGLERHDLEMVEVWTRQIVRSRDELKAIGITPVGFDHYRTFDLPSFILESSHV